MWRFIYYVFFGFFFLCHVSLTTYMIMTFYRFFLVICQYILEKDIWLVSCWLLCRFHYHPRLGTPSLPCYLMPRWGVEVGTDSCLFQEHLCEIVCNNSSELWIWFTNSLFCAISVYSTKLQISSFSFFIIVNAFWWMDEMIA